MYHTYGQNIKVTVFGSSHSDEIGVSVKGIPAGSKIDLTFVDDLLKRRKAGAFPGSTARLEKDEYIIEKGIENSAVTGDEIVMSIKNTDVNKNDYDITENILRPGHADYSQYVKNGSIAESGGGEYSGRMTAAYCLAGGICLSLLSEYGIVIASHIYSISDIYDDLPDTLKVSEELLCVKNKSFPCINDDAGKKMTEKTAKAKSEGDSLGGIIETFVYGLKPGLGNPLFGSLESVISGAVFSVPAVKAVEFGKGFDLSKMKGSESNDPFIVKDGRVSLSKNDMGGILGGVSDSMPLYFRCAIKPTPSISKEQCSVDIAKKENVTLMIKGRHDTCIVPRAIPCIEAVCAISLYDLILGDEKYGD